MRAAPAIDLPLTHDGPWPRAGAALAAASAAVPAGWLAWRLGASESAVLVLPWLAAAAALAWRGAAMRPGREPGRLQWTGAAWQLRQPGEPAPRALAHLAVRLDLGCALLLRGQEAGGRRHWIAVRRQQAGAAWPGLRVALAHGGHAVRRAVR